MEKLTFFLSACVLSSFLLVDFEVNAMARRIRTPTLVRRQRSEEGSKNLKKAFTHLVKNQQIVVPNGQTDEILINDFLNDQSMGCEAFAHKKSCEIRKLIITWYSIKYLESQKVMQQPMDMQQTPQLLWQNGRRPAVADNKCYISDNTRDNKIACEIVNSEEPFFAFIDEIY